MSNITNVLSELGATPFFLLNSMIISAVGWFFVSLLIVLVLFFALRGRGWLDTKRGRKSGWSRIGFLLILLLVVGPAITATGTVCALREKIVDTVHAKSLALGGSQMIGYAVLAPLVIVHELTKDLTAENASAVAKSSMDEISTDQIAQILWGMEPKADVSYLLQENRDMLTALLSGHLPQTVAKLILAKRAASSAIDRVVLEYAFKKNLGAVEERLGVYTSLLSEIKADSDNRLTWQSAAVQTGDRLLANVVDPLIRSLFLPYILLFGMLGLLPPFLWIGTVRWIAGRKERKQMTSGEPAATATADNGVFLQGDAKLEEGVEG